MSFYECLFYVHFWSVCLLGSSSNDFIIDLFLENFQLLNNTQKETFFWKSVFAGVRKSELQGYSVREKGSVSKNITGAWGKNVSKNTAGLRGGRNFFSKQKKFSWRYAIYHICGLVNCLADSFPGFLERPKCQYSFFCSTNHRGGGHGNTSTTSSISSIKTAMIFL